MPTAEKRLEMMTMAGAKVTLECHPKSQFGEGGVLRGKREIVGTFWRINVDVKGAYGRTLFHSTGTGETLDAAIDQAFDQERLEEITAAFSLASPCAP